MVAELRAALAEDYVLAAALAALAEHRGHVLRGHELRLLHVERLAGAARRREQVSLAAEEGRYLKQVDVLRRSLGLPRLVNVRDYGDAGLAPDLREPFEPLLDSGAAVALYRSPVRFVEGSLEYIAEAEFGAVFLHRLRNRQRLLEGVEHARAGGHGERSPSDGDVPDLHHSYVI